MKNNVIRKPVVAGKFYPESNEELKAEIKKLVDVNTKKSDVVACVLPHAGYVYSGGVAARTVSAINLKKRIIILGPNHTGYGLPFSIMTKGIWQSPLGEVSVDNELAEAILDRSKYLKDDPLAHLYEHSLEVELPFLQYFSDNFKIVPIVLSSNNLKVLKDIGKEIAESIISLGLKDSVMIIASSDMTHYESQETARAKDKAAIQAILELNEDKLADKVNSLNISMCGFAPVVVMLSAAKLLGAQKGIEIKYQTSGDITGDKSSVVGYCGILIQ